MSTAYTQIIVSAKDEASKVFSTASRRIGIELNNIKNHVFSLQNAFAALGIGAFSKQIFDMGSSLRATKRAFVEIVGSVQGANKEFEFLRRTADALGQNFYDLLEPYKQLIAAAKGSALEGEKTRQVFLGIAKAGATLGLSSEQVKGALNAVAQMISKNKVEAEELRGQLGERLPGAFNLAAEAMGVTTAELDKMLKTGKITAEEFLPKFAQTLQTKFSGSIDEAVRATNKFREAWTDFKTALATGEYMDSTITALEELTNILKDKEIQKAVGDLATGIAKTAKEIVKTGGALDDIFALYNKLSDDMKGDIGIGLLGAVLFGPKGGVLIGALAHEIRAIMNSIKGFELARSGQLDWLKFATMNAKELADYLEKIRKQNEPYKFRAKIQWVDAYGNPIKNPIQQQKKKLKDVGQDLKKAIQDLELDKLVQKVTESLTSPIEKLIQEKSKLDKLVKAGKISHDQELEYLAKEAKAYYNLKSPIEKVMEILSGAPNTWDKNLQALKNNEQAVNDFIKHLQDLERYAQQLETSAQTPLQKFTSGFEKLQETEALVGLSNKAYAEGLLELSKNIVDTTNKEDKLRDAFAFYADELKQMPAEEVATKIKELAKSFEEHESVWEKGIKAYINDVKSMKDEIADLIHGMFSELEDMLVRFLTSGKLSIKEFSDYLINQIARIYVRQYMLKPLAQYMLGITPAPTIPNIFTGSYSYGGGTSGMPPFLGSNPFLSPGLWNSILNIGSTSTNDIIASGISAITNNGMIMTAAPLAASSAFSGLSLMPAATTSSAFSNLSLMPAVTGTSATTGAFSNLSLIPAATATTSGLSLAQALPYAGLGSLGYTLLGGLLGLPQSSYSSITSGAGGFGGALAASALGVNPIVGGIIGAALGGLGGGLLGHTHIDDVDLHIYFGNPNVIPTSMNPKISSLEQAINWTDNPNIQGISSDIQFFGSPNREFFERDRAINEFLSVNVRKGSHLSEEEAAQIEKAIRDYFTNLFNSIEQEFGIDLQKALQDKAVGFHEDKYSGDIQSTINKYTEEFFKNFTDELTESILGYSIDYDTLKKLQQSGESIANTFSRVVENLKNIPHAGELIGEYLAQTGDKVVEATEQTSKKLQELPESTENISDLFSQSGDKVVEAYNKLVETWAQINDIVDKAFQNMTFPKSVEDFKKQLTTNIRLEIAQALEQSYMEQLAQQTKEWLLERFGITDWSQLIENLQNGTISLEAFNAALEELADSVGGTADKIIQKANEVISQVEPEQPTESDHEGYSNVQEALQAGDYNAATQMLFPFAQTDVTYSYIPESAQDTTQQQVQSILEGLQKIDITKGWKDFKEDFMKTIRDAITEQLQSKFITDVTQNINSYLAERYNPYDIINNIWTNIYNASYAGGVSSLDMASIADNFKKLKQSLELTGEGLQKINSDIQQYTSYQNIDEVISQLEAGNVNYGDIESLASILVQERLTNFPVINNIDDLINQINSGAITIEQASKILGDINQILDDNKKDYDEIFLKLVAIGEIDLSGIIDKIPNITDIIQNYVTASNSSLVEAYEKLVEQWDYINKLISDSLKQIKDPFSHNLKQQFLTNFKQQIGEKLIQKFYQDLGDQISGYIFSTFGIADYTELVDAIYSGKISIEGLTNALDDMGNVIDSNNSKLDELFVKQIQLGNIDISWVNNIENISQIVQDYINRTGKGLVSAYEELKDEWDYIYNLVSQSFQNITLPFDTKSLKQQFFSNFKLNLGNQILQTFYKDLSEQITGAILSEYGMSDLEQLSNWLLDGKLSTEDFNNALEDLGNILDQNNPKIEHLKQILEDLGLLDDYYKQQYEQAKANYISALQAEISDLQQKQQQLEQNFQKAKQTYIQVLQNEISELQKAQQQLEQNFQKAKNDYINALQAEINKKQEATNSAKSLIETFKNLSDSLESFKQDLIGSETNPASYNYTRAQFLSLIPKLASSDNKILQETIQKIPDTARAFLEQSKQYNTYEEYLKNYYSVIKIINKAQDKSLDIQKEQQNKLDNIKSEIEELNERYKEINGQDIKDLAEAEQAYYQAKLELDKSHYPEEIQKYNDILEELQGTLPDIATASKDYRDALNALKNSYYPTAIQKYQDILKELQGIHRDLPTAEREYKKAKEEYEQHTGNKTNDESSLNNTTTSRLVVNSNSFRHLSQATAVDMVLTGRVSAETYVENLYEKYLGRKADTSGLHYWTEQAKKAKSYSDLYHLERAFKEAAKSHGEQLKARFYAKGGTVYKPTLAVVGEAGIEHITPDSQMKEVKEKLGEIKEILWMMLNTTGDNKKVLIKLNNLITGWDYEGLPATREQ